MADPLADHEHNLLTTLKLFERLQGLRRALQTRRLRGGGLHAWPRRPSTSAEATQEDAPVSLDLDSPYQISKIVGEFYSHLLPRRGTACRPCEARFQNVYGPGEVLGAGRWRGTPATVWRNVTPTFVYRALKGEAAAGSTTAASRRRDFIYVGDIVARPARLRDCAATPGDVYNLASGVETSIRELAETINELVRQPAPTRARSAARLGPLGQRFGSTEKAERELGFEARPCRSRRASARRSTWTREHPDLIDAAVARHAERVGLAVGEPTVAYPRTRLDRSSRRVRAEVPRGVLSRLPRQVPGAAPDRRQASRPPQRDAPLKPRRRRSPVPSGTRIPAPSGEPDATTGFPYAAASSTGRPSPAPWLGKTTMSSAR